MPHTFSAKPFLVMQNKLNLKEKKEPDSSERPNEQPWIVSNNLFIDITVISTFNSKTMI